MAGIDLGENQKFILGMGILMRLFMKAFCCP